jgi:DNA-binding PadR family transcriptional regulator
MGKKEPREFLPLTEANFHILIALASPNHGYGIMKGSEELSGGQVRIGPGTLYAALASLLQEGLIERVGTDDGEERRKTYALTAQGREVVAAEIERMESLAAIGKAALATSKRS